MEFNLTNIEMYPSRNGFSLSAKFFINGFKVADFIDAGDGGQPQFIMTNNKTALKLFSELEQKLSELPELYLEMYDMNTKIDKYMFIDLLLYALENKTEFKLLAA